MDIIEAIKSANEAGKSVIFLPADYRELNNKAALDYAKSLRNVIEKKDAETGEQIK